MEGDTMIRKPTKDDSKISLVIEEPEVLTNYDITKSMERFRVFARSLFGENDEVGTIKIKKGQRDPAKITMLKVKREFILEQKARQNSERTIETYIKQFNLIYDFLGFQYLLQSRKILDDAVDNNENYGTARDIGASMPVLVLELDGFVAFYQDYLLNVRNVKQQTMITAIRHLRAIIYFAQQQGWIKEFKVTVKDVQPDLKSTFTANEIKLLSRKPKKNDFVAYRSYVMIQYLASTGNRISSLLALDVKDIDFEQGTITVNIQKNRKPKLMPLIYDLRKILNEYIYLYRSDEKTGLPLVNEPLFCNNYGQRMTYTTARDAMKDYFESRGVVWEGFHKFRHSYATNWIRDGGNPFMLKEQLGHSSLAMTNRYVNIYGMATKDEAEQHSLSNKFTETTGRKAIKMRK